MSANSPPAAIYGPPPERPVDINDGESVLREVAETVETEREVELMSEELFDRHPALKADSTWEEIGPTLTELGERHGEAFARDPQVIGAVYVALGGDARFATAAEDEQIVSEMLGAAGVNDLFTHRQHRPAPEE